MDWTTSIITFWQNDHIKLNGGCSEAQIKEAEKILDFTFPPAFKALYFQVNGFAEGGWTQNHFHIWSIDTIIEEYQQTSDKNFIGFTDYFIHSHHIGFAKDKKGVFKYNEFIAETFEEAMQLIQDDSDLIY